MSKLSIKVNISNQDKIIKWFREVHTFSRIDFYYVYKDLYLLNEFGDSINVGIIDKNDVYNIIKSKFEYSSDSEWIENVRKRCSEAYDSLQSIIPMDSMSDREVFDLYVNSKHFTRGVEPAWYIGDITVHNSEDGLYTVEFEIKSNDNDDSQAAYWDEREWLNKKYELELKLADIFFSLTDNISIPINEELQKRKYIVGKMFFALKGICIFKRVSSLELIKNRIIDEKYPQIDNSNINFCHPLEIMEPIEEVEYKQPPTIVWADIISAMGMFSFDEKDDTDRLIRICRENIEKTVRYLSLDSNFEKKIRSDIKNVYKKTEIETDDLLVRRLIDIVISHECGHMIFRSIKKDLTVKENESLANWVACLMHDLLDNEFIEILSTHQSDEYKEMISIPVWGNIKRNTYSNYCDKLNKLIRSW